MTTPRVSRRAFIRGLFVLFGAAALGLGVVFRPGGAHRVITAVVRKKLAYLTIAESDLEAFVEAFLDANRDPAWRRRLSPLTLTLPIYERSELLAMTPLANSIERLEEQVVTEFLLSSDFFSQGEDTTRAVRYVASYDPYDALCGNPFARFE